MCIPTGSAGDDAVAPETILSHEYFADQERTEAAIESLRQFVPASKVCTAAFELITDVDLPLAILNHSFRVYLLAKRQQEQEKTALVDDDLLFVASLFHDTGASHELDGNNRFEIAGANLATSFMSSQHLPLPDHREVWAAIALHTSPEIAECFSPLSRLVRLGVLADFRGVRGSQLDADKIAFAEGIEENIPRLEIEKVLGSAVVRQAVKNPNKAPAASWPGLLYRSYLEDPYWTGVNKAF